jgi:hypothetical protein
VCDQQLCQAKQVCSTSDGVTFVCK